MRNITKQDFFEVHKQNSNFREKDFFGIQALELSSYEAFIYSTITGSQFLDDLVFPFTPKGLMKVFHSDSNDRIVTGLWSGMLPYFTPSRIVADRPFLSQEVKYLVPVEFETEIDYANQISTLFVKQRYPGEILVHRIESSKDGCGQEGLLEYLSCEYFRSFGYLVDSQIPLSQQFGSPDWMAASPSLLNLDEDTFKSRYIFELGMQSVKWDSKPEVRPGFRALHQEIVVGEAKVSSGSHSKQIGKYLKSQIFNRAVLSITDYSEKYLGISDQLFFDSSWKLDYIRCISAKHHSDEVKTAIFSDFLVTLGKFFLLSNFSVEEISQLLDLNISVSGGKQSELLMRVREIPLEKLIIK